MARATLTVVTPLILALAYSSAWAQADNPPLTAERSVELEVPRGWLGTALTARDGHLWMGAQSVHGPSKLLRYAPRGDLLGQIETTSDGNVGGIAFDGHGVCNLDYSTSMKSGSRALHRLSTDGRVRKAATRAPGGHNTFGLAWHGTGFFQGHSPTIDKSSVIHRLDANGRELSAHKMPFYTRGMTWHNGQLWVTTGVFRTLHVLDPDLNIVRSYELPVALADIAFVDGALFGLEHNRNRLHRFELPGARPASSVLAASELASNGYSRTGW